MTGGIGSRPRERTYRRRIDARAKLVHGAPMKTDRVVNSRIVGLVVAAAALCTDQLAKWFVTDPLALRFRGVRHPIGDVLT